jgi:hypothetical protein
MNTAATRLEDEIREQVRSIQRQHMNDPFAYRDALIALAQHHLDNPHYGDNFISVELQRKYLLQYQNDVFNAFVNPTRLHPDFPFLGDDNPRVDRLYFWGLLGFVAVMFLFGYAKESYDAMETKKLYERLGI